MGLFPHKVRKKGRNQLDISLPKVKIGRDIAWGQKEKIDMNALLAKEGYERTPVYVALPVLGEMGLTRTRQQVNRAEKKRE